MFRKIWRQRFILLNALSKKHIHSTNTFENYFIWVFYSYGAQCPLSNNLTWCILLWILQASLAEWDQSATSGPYEAVCPPTELPPARLWVNSTVRMYWKQLLIVCQHRKSFTQNLFLCLYLEVGVNVWNYNKQFFLLQSMGRCMVTSHNESVLLKIFKTWPDEFCRPIFLMYVSDCIVYVFFMFRPSLHNTVLHVTCWWCCVASNQTF